MSPCAVIKDEGNSFRRIRENCEEVYNDVFVEPLKEICKDLDKDNSTFYEFMNPQREKRFIFLVGVALVVVISMSIFLENLGLSISLTTILGLLLLGAIIYGLIRWFKKKRSNRLRHNRNQSNRGPSIEMENL